MHGCFPFFSVPLLPNYWERKMRICQDSYLCVHPHAFLYSGVDQMTGVLLVQRVSMWWWSLVEETDCMCAKKYVHDFSMYRVLCIRPLSLFVCLFYSSFYTAFVVGQWIHKHDRKCLHLYTSQGACVVALHAFVEEINSVTVRQSLKRRNGLYFYQEGFAHILSFMGT